MEPLSQPSPDLSRKAVVLLSGGLDSAVTLAYARKQDYICYALTVDYGQRHRVEIQRAKKIAKILTACQHKILKVNLRMFGGSALTDNIPVPLARQVMGMQSDVPATYVPARNTIFLALALAWAEVIQARAIFIGVNAVDFSGYPDCRPEFIEAFEHVARLATKAGTQEEWNVKIAAPLLHCSKAEIVSLGRELNLDFSLTTSCYNPTSAGQPCGVCESCKLRQKGFEEAGEIDPLRP